MQDKTIEILNKEVKCKLAQSDVHGVGVFTIRDVKKGEKLYCNILYEEKKFFTLNDLSELLPEIKDLIVQRWAVALDGHSFLHPNQDAHLLSFMNYSVSPNYNNQTDLALEDIAKGEEVFEDYGMYTKDLLLIK